jgi:hypothetical protein
MDKRLLILIATCLVFTACQEEIDLDLKNAQTKTVIEGNITNTGDPATVLVSQTTAFKDSLFYKGLNGAVVTVTDGNNHTDTLQPITGLGVDGVYASFTLQTQVGQTYHLKVEVNGNTYESTSQVFPATPIDSIYITDGGFDDKPRLTFDYHDPTGVENYYKADVNVNGLPKSTVEISDDMFTDGLKKTISFGSVEDLATGDTLDIIFKSIDKNVYTYFSTLLSNTSLASAAPANPISNISNGALGYFNACAATKRRYYFP